MPSTASVATLPNLISVGRIMLVPVIVALILNGHPGAALLAFAVAGVSDAVDGIVAARLDMRSKLGAVLDPLADKILLVSMFVVLAVLGELPVWLAVLVVGRDVVILVAVALAWLAGRPAAIGPLRSSKINTVVQISVVGAVLVQLGLRIELGGVIHGLVVATAVTTLVSASDYLLAWLRRNRVGLRALRMPQT